MDCRQWNVKPAYQMETSLGFGLGLQPHHSKCLLVKVSTSHAHLLLEAIASQLWTTSVHPLILHCVGAPRTAKLPKIVHSYF